MSENTQRKIRFNLAGLFVIMSVILIVLSKEVILFIPALFGIYFIYKKILHPKDRIWPTRYNIDGTLNIQDEKYYTLDKESRKKYENYQPPITIKKQTL